MRLRKSPKITMMIKKLTIVLKESVITWTVSVQVRL